MWEEIKKNFDAWWAHRDLGRPLARIVGRREPMKMHEKFSALSARDIHLSAEYRVALVREQMEHCTFYADAFPYVDLNLGPGSLAAYLLCEPAFSAETVWYKEAPEGISSAEQAYPFDRRTKWWEEHLAKIRKAVSLSEGEFLVGIPDIQEGLDILSAMIGPEELCYRLIDEPDKIAGLRKAIDEQFFRCYEEMYDAVKDEHGDSCFTVFSILGRGKTAKIQCDFSSLISTDLFDEFVIPGLQLECDLIPNTLYHLDGVGALRHVPSLMKIGSLKALQWTSGAGQEDGGSEKWYPLYDQVIGAEKSLWIQIYQGNVDDWICKAKKLLKRYGTKGMYFIFGDTSDNDARKIVKELKL